MSNLNPQLSQEERLALYNLSQSRDFWVLKKILETWKAQVDTVSDLDSLMHDIPARVAGKQYTLGAIASLLEYFAGIDGPRKSRLKTHE